MMPVIYQAVYAVIFLWAVWCICSRKVNDGVLGRVFYSAIALAAFAAFFAKQHHPRTLKSAPNLLRSSHRAAAFRHEAG